MLQRTATPVNRREFLRQLAVLCTTLPMPQIFANSLVIDQTLCAQLGGSEITWIVPNAPGGGYDRLSRLIEPHIENALSATIVIRNLPGAGGMVGAQTILHAPPDGGTLGIINGAGMLAASLAGEKKAPNPATDFTLLCRVSTSKQVWATGKDSPLNSINDVFEAAKSAPLVCGTRDVSSLGFINLTLTANLLGINIAVVPGYLGSGAGTMAALRGEVDLIAYNFDSIRPQIESGDIRPLLQITNERISPDPLLNDVPCLGSPDGIAVQRSSHLERSKEKIEIEASAIVNLLGAGRLIVGPPEMPSELSNCLESTLIERFASPEFIEDAQKTKFNLDIAGSEASRRQILSVSAQSEKFIPIITEAIQKVR